MPKAKQHFRFNKEKWIREKSISERKFVFLDTFVWSEMIRAESQVFKDLREVLTQSVMDKQIIVVINISLVTEVTQRADAEQTKRILALFDTLSDGVYLNSSHTIFCEELEERVVSRLEGRPIERLSPNVVFGPMVEMLGSFYIDWPFLQMDIRGFAPNEVAENYLGVIADLELTDLPEVWMHRPSAYKNAITDHLNEKYRQTIPTMTYSDILEEEQSSLAMHFAPWVAEVYNDVKGTCEDLESAKLYERIISQELRQLFVGCPTIAITSEIHAKLRLQKDEYKSLKPNDFYDALHLSCAIPNCDYVLCDRGMAHMCKTELQLDNRYQTTIFSSNETDNLISEIVNI